MMNRKYFRWIRIIAGIYALAGIAFYFLQDRILFHPVQIPREEKFEFGVPFREINIPYNRETNLNIVEFLPEKPAKGVVLYFHGNRQNIRWYAKNAGNFTRNQYEVWMIDYPGFGKSTGKLTEDNLYTYALEFYKLARSRFEPAEIIIYGKSLGTGIASQLASVRDCRFLVLETPYYSLVSLVSHYLPIYPVEQMLNNKLSNAGFLPRVTAPVIILHGTSDALIPYSQARKLGSLFKPGDELIAIPGGGHNNLTEFPLFHRELDSLLQR